MTLLTASTCPIPLGVCRSGIPVCNSQLTTVSPKGFAVEPKSIVRDEGMRYPKASDNVLPEKLLYIHISDIRQRLSFNLFGEIVCTDQQIFLFPTALGNGPTISKPHCVKGQGLERGFRNPRG